MSKKVTGMLYGISRATGKAATRMNDVETILSGNPKKIVKRFAKKAINKTAFKTANKISNKLFK
jgi:hypothetical protein